MHLQLTVVHTLCGLLAGVADYQLKLGRLTKKRKPVDPKRSRRQGDKAGENRIEPPPPPADLKAAFLAKHPRPEVLAHLVLGINEVGKELSAKPPLPAPIGSGETSTAAEDGAPAIRRARPPPASPLRYVFVCLSDINPATLVGHLPAAVAGWNGRNKAAGEADATGVRLVTLAKGAEALLAQALGVRRAAVVGVRVRRRGRLAVSLSLTTRQLTEHLPLSGQASCPPALLSQLEAVLPFNVLPPLLVEHLIPPSVKVRSSKPASDATPAFLSTQPGAPAATTGASTRQPAKTRPKATKTLPEAQRSLAPMRVKMVKTSAPKDMKAAKAERTLAVAQKRKAHKALKKAQARGATTDQAAAGGAGVGKSKGAGRRAKQSSRSGAPAA